MKKILVEKDPIKSIKSITTLRATRTAQILKLMMKNEMVGLFDPDLPADDGASNLDDGRHDDHEDQDDDPDTDRIEPGRHPRPHPIHPYGAIVHTSVARRPPVLTGGGSASIPPHTFIIDANPYKGNA